jgi:N-glycosylase/DNA lyase
VVGESIVVAIKEVPETTLYRILHGPPDLPYAKILHQYFQLDCPLAPLYETWSQQDPQRLARIAPCIPGVRLVDQDPWECLISFICSSNNNIPRITKMLQALRQHYGKPLVTIQGEIDETVLYSFPSLKELKSKATEDDLRSLCGMGYRAKYIMTTMDILESLGGEQYLHELRNNQDPIQVQESLLAFHGVGRKVADCVALFSLRQADAIPVDTHVWNLCRRDYDKDGVFQEVKSLTPAIYRQVGDTFRDRFNPKAGWAHSLLFVAELPSFRPVLHEDIVEEMDRVSQLSITNCVSLSYTH